MNVSVSFDAKQVSQQLVKLAGAISEKGEQAMEYTMTDAENNAKNGAPWVDRTGDARKSIGHKVEAEAHAIKGHLFIGVDYGVFLELSNQGKYRIIRPTIDNARSVLIQSLKGIL